MIETYDIASAASAGFLNWAVYDGVDGKNKKWAMLKLAISVAALAARAGMGPPECTLRDLQILAAATTLCSLISALPDTYNGNLGKTVLKLGLGVVASAGLQLTHFPKEVVLHNALTFTMYGGYASAAVCSIWSAHQLFKGYRNNNILLLKGGLLTALHILPSIGMSLAIREIGY